ncbi:MAG: hypothetical protein ABMA64_03565 [Myxococcota bacterium]
MLLAWIGAEAQADQCAWITKAQADAAVRRLTPGSEWLPWCEPCGDAIPARAKKVGRATASPVDSGGFWEVSIDGAPVDLAYTYVHDGADKGFTNLALLSDCPATGVTRRTPWPPTTEHADRLASWLGTYQQPLVRLKITQYYDDPNGLAIQIDTPTEHPSQAATLTLMSYADIDADPVTFATPLGGCKVRLDRAPTGVVLHPGPACAGLLDGIAGPYRKVGQ